MRGQTRSLTEQIRQALLGLPDTLLLDCITTWATQHAGEELEYDETGEFAEVCGYRVRSAVSGTIYLTIVDLLDAEPHTDGWSFVPPTAAELRADLAAISTRDVYHTIVFIAGEALAGTPLTRAWGTPPDAHGDGYAWMAYFADHLRFLALLHGSEAAVLPKDESGGALLSQQDWQALQDAIRTELDLPVPPDDPIEVREDAQLIYEFGDYHDLAYWELHALEQQRDRALHPVPTIDPAICVCDGSLRLAIAWLQAHGAAVEYNLATIRAQDSAACDCGVVLRALAWPGPELRHDAVDLFGWMGKTQQKKARGKRR